MSPAPATRRNPGGNRTLLYVGLALAAAVVVVLLIRARGAGGSLVSSGTPGPDLTGSAAQQPTGGASSIPGNLPPLLVSQPDALQQQVQQTDASGGGSASTAAATASAPLSGYATPVTVNGTPTTSTVVIGGHGFEQSAPGSDYYRSVPLSEAAPSSNVHRPGVQF